ncbi:HIT family protein [Lactiplantibacillus pentosus]|nr:HIT family protein [Lactiplantibacillus pentosus]AYG41223.1 HIT family protein [Lactiplantibacillus pentosus]
MPTHCTICERIKLIQQHQNPYFVRELTTGYVVLADSQYFEGYTLFLAKSHVTELHHLAAHDQLLFLEEMSLVQEACAQAFHADKMNIELLGNGDAHVHWHLFPRHTGDTAQPGPIWWTPLETIYGDDVQQDQLRLTRLKRTLNTALDSVLQRRQVEHHTVQHLTLPSLDSTDTD